MGPGAERAFPRSDPGTRVHRLYRVFAPHLTTPGGRALNARTPQDSGRVRRRPNIHSRRRPQSRSHIRMTRRTFVAASGIAAAAAAADTTTPERLPIKKAVLYSMLPKTLSPLDRFQLARDCGFEQIECGTTDDPHEADALLEASKKTEVRIHSVMNRDHWKYPLSSSAADLVGKCVAGIKTSLHNAKLWGADTVLLVPAVVGPDTTYKQAWERSQKQIRDILPLDRKSTRLNSSHIP